MRVNYELKTKNLNKTDFLPQVFWGTFFLLLGMVFAFISIILIFPFLLGVASFYGYIFFRKSNENEMIKIEDNILKAYRGGKVIVSIEVKEIKDIDIDSYSLNAYLRGQTMIVFYFLNGESFSLNYVNYEHDDLVNLKKIILNANAEDKLAS